MRRCSRRSLLAAAGLALAGPVLGGCAGLTPALTALGVHRPLRVTVIGLTPRAGAAMVRALTAAGRAWTRSSGRPDVVQAAATPVPEALWYACSPGAACGPAVPLAPSLSLFTFSPSAAVALRTSTGFVGVRGRSSLNFAFGAPVPPVLPAPSPTGMPDLVVAYDLWQYWLAPLAIDLRALWRAHPEDRAGLPSGLAAHGRFYAGPARGTILTGLPLLRNPMLLGTLRYARAPGTPRPTAPDLFAAAAGPTWTWGSVAQAVRAAGTAFSTAGFAGGVGPLVRTAAAAALVAAYGGRLADSGGLRVRPAFDSPAASAALALRAGLLAAGRSVPLSPGAVTGQVALQPQWLVGPFGEPGAAAQGPCAVLPRGPVRAASPCLYCCAWVLAGGRQPPRAADFAAFLLSPGGQGALAGSALGLPLRPQAALDAARRAFPNLRQPQTAVSPAADLTAALLYGGTEDAADRGSWARIADAFAAAVRRLDAPLAAPSAVGGLLRRAAREA